jgi:hypothetical protein
MRIKYFDKFFEVLAKKNRRAGLIVELSPHPKRGAPRMHG